MIKDNKDNFRKKNKRGRLGECIGIELTESRGHTVGERSIGNENRYDFKYTSKLGKEHLVEVKTDYTKTPNLAIEFESKNSPSGISITKSDIFMIVHIHDMNIYPANTTKLREYIAKNDLVKVRNNEDPSTFMYLINKDDFKNICSPISYRHLHNAPTSIEEAKAMADAIPDGCEDVWTLEECASYPSMPDYLSKPYQATHPS